MISSRENKNLIRQIFSQAADEWFVTSSRYRRRNKTRFFFPPRRCFKAKPGAVRGAKSGHTCLHQKQRQSRVMWPKCGCPSGSLLPTYGYSIPTLLHGSTRGKFSSAGCSLIQVGEESAPPWTGDVSVEQASPTGSPTNRSVHTEALLLPVTSSD